MWEDPIIAETRALREEMMNEAGGDLNSLYEYLVSEQKQHKDRLVRPSPRRPIPLGAAASAPLKTGG